MYVCVCVREKNALIICLLFDTPQKVYIRFVCKIFIEPIQVSSIMQFSLKNFLFIPTTYRVKTFATSTPVRFRSHIKHASNSESV